MKLLAQLILAGLITATATTCFAQSSQEQKNESSVETETISVQEKAPAVEKDKADVITFKGLSRYDIRRDNRPGREGETRKSLWRKPFRTDSKFGRRLEN